MPAFPINLPKPTQSYSATNDPKLVTNKFETNFRQRVRYSRTEETISVSWLFTQLQYDLFLYFHKNLIANGSLPFDIDVIGLDGLKSISAQMIDGKFQARYMPHRHQQVSCNLLVKNKPVMDSLIADLMLADYGIDPDLFKLLSDVLYAYVETVYGDAEASELVSSFLKTYS